MRTLHLVIPDEQHKEVVMEYKQEFILHGDSMDGCAGLDVYETFEQWLAANQANRKEETLTPGLVCATTFLALNEQEELIGMIDVRHRLNDYLERFGGHIGYSVRKCQRRKGYATQMLAMALGVCEQISLQKVLITCDKGNAGSAKTILNNGGVLENEISHEGTMIQRYWIAL